MFEFWSALRPIFFLVVIHAVSWNLQHSIFYVAIVSYQHFFNKVDVYLARAGGDNRISGIDADISLDLIVIILIWRYIWPKGNDKIGESFKGL